MAMKIVFMGKSKDSSIAALQFLLASDCEIAAVVAPEKSPLAQFASDNNLNLLASADDIPSALGSVDLIVSFLYWKRISASVISHAKIACLNFHPAPLPEFRGLGGYNFAILEDAKEWGVSAHYVDPSFDTGDLIQVNRFAIHAEEETAQSLEARSQKELTGLFQQVMEKFFRSEEIPRQKQAGGRYINRQAFEAARKILPGDSPAVIDRKVRAFWFPPFEGAFIERDGVAYTLVSARLLRLLFKK